MDQKPFSPALARSQAPASSNARDAQFAPPGGASFETIDRLSRATLARFTQGVSPHAESAAWFEWASHLARAPGRQLELALLALNASARLARFVLNSTIKGTADEKPFAPSKTDRRFAD
jgi:polyhydroxyalkanoate synthase